MDEDSASFISFSSCDVTWRLNFIPSFSFHFIKTSRKREASCKLVKKLCRGDGGRAGYRRVIIVVYAKKIRRKHDKMRKVIHHLIYVQPRVVSITITYTNGVIKIRINNLNTMLMQR